MWKVVAALLTLASLAATTDVKAQEWPKRPLTMINPFAAGGPNDVLARLFAQRMGEILGQPIIIENVGGAGGMNGADRVAKAAPDGYTFLQGTVGTQAQNQTLFKKPAYNSTTDFAPVALMVEAPLVLIARKDLPVKDMKEFVAYAKANKDKMQFGSAGTGSAIHLGCALMNMVAGLDIVHVPTAIEQGFDVDAYTWNAFFLPKGTPETIVQKLNHATIEAMKTAAVREKLESAGLKFVSDDRTTPAYLATFVQSEIAKWAAPIKASGVSVD
jgi:tripartite-type tricarboxylate transporter receptor subunit TctC